MRRWIGLLLLLPAPAGFGCAPAAVGPESAVATWLVARRGELSGPSRPPFALAPGDRLLGFQDSSRALGFDHVDPAGPPRPVPAPGLSLEVDAAGALVPADPPPGLRLPAIDWHRAAEQGACSRRAAGDDEAWLLHEPCAPPSPTPPSPPRRCEESSGCRSGCSSAGGVECEGLRESWFSQQGGRDVTLRKSELTWVDLSGARVRLEDVTAEQISLEADEIELVRVSVTENIVIPGRWWWPPARRASRVVLEDVSAASIRVTDAAEVVLRRVRVASVDSCPRLHLGASRATVVDLVAADDGPSTRCQANPSRPAACVFVDLPTVADARSLELSRFELRRCNFGLASYDPGLVVRFSAGRFSEVRAAYAVPSEAPLPDPAPLLEDVVLGGAPLFAR